MSTWILLATAEPSALRILCMSLKQEGYLIDQSFDGHKALDRISRFAYNIVLLDAALPKLSGIEVCKCVRETCDVPIIVFSHNGNTMDEIMSLEYGAHDYIIDPSNLLVFKARVKAILRRTIRKPIVPVQLSVGKLFLDTSTRSVKRNGITICLGAYEYELLKLFMLYPERLFTKEELLSAIWGSDNIKDYSLLAHGICRLRKKIDNDSNNLSYILSKRGVGYYFKSA